jgi:protein involved in polysaccharide export with SLBB domain
MGNSRLRFFHSAILAFLLIGAGATASLGQNVGQYIGPYQQQKTALDVPDSRAELEAEQLVALSADKIISILRDEDGLMLQVKKALVRKAYEQGRLLDPEDLTDDAVFRLLQEDHNVRIVATREIEDRYYIKAKPSRDELYRNCLLYGQLSGPPQPTTTLDAIQKPNGQTDPLSPHSSQEQIYWAKHEDNLFLNCPIQLFDQNQTQNALTSVNTQPPQIPGQVPSTINPQQTLPPQTSPQNLPTQDPRRLMMASQMQSGAGNYYENMDPGSSMTRIRPEDLPQLLSASSTQQLGGSSNPLSGGASSLSDLASRYASSNSSSFGSSTMGMGLSLSDLISNRGLGTVPQQTTTMASLPQQPTTGFPPLPEYPTRPILQRRPNPYADVPSLYDMYSQYSRRSPMLQRFGADIFTNGTGNFDELPMDVPAGPEYVVGPGDGLKIEMFGGYSDSLMRVVDRDGRLALPEVGSVQVAGRNLGDVQRLVQSTLRTQFRDVDADVSLARLRTVRVYVVGDVQRGGAYDVSSLSTPLNAVYLAGGPTSRGSMRILKLYRGKQLVQTIDVYDLLLHGVRADIQHLEPGDTIMVPPIGPEVKIQGMVRRPAIYELNGEANLAQVLELAGGVLASGTLRNVDVERVEAHQSRTMLRLDIPELNNQEAVTKKLEDFKIQDGDDVKISPIVPFADRTVYLDGHVFRPGKYAYQDGMKVTDLIKSYSDLLPEPYKKHAEIIRLQAPDYTPTVIAFNLESALAGKEQDVTLKPFDTIRVFGRFDFEDAPVITVSGEVRDPGDHVTNGATYLRDAVYLAGGATPDALLDDAQVFRRTEDGKLKVLDVNLAKALDGDSVSNILLTPKDRIFIHKNMTKTDPPTVKIEGEVSRPGKYPLGQQMSAAELVKVAGGLKRGAFTDAADLTRYTVEGGQKVVGEYKTVEIGKALAGEPDTDVRLRDGDVLTIRQLTGWKDVGATIKVEGEVVHPGTYGIREGERLSSIIARAGGFRAEAYPYGSIFQRVQVREMQEKNRAELIRQTQDQGPTIKSATIQSPDDKLAQDAALMQWQATLERLRDTPPGGRLVIHISQKTEEWTNGASDLQVRDGDILYIPKKPNAVMVDGSVYNPTAVSYKPGKSAGWYLKQAGGPTNFANKGAMFVIRADGSMIAGKGGLFTGSVEDATLQAGDMVLVPEKGFSTNARWKTVLQIAQIAYYVGISTQVARSF